VLGCLNDLGASALIDMVHPAQGARNRGGRYSSPLRNLDYS
jgi:hypothetical protein